MTSIWETLDRLDQAEKLANLEKKRAEDEEKRRKEAEAQVQRDEEILSQLEQLPHLTLNEGIEHLNRIRVGQELVGFQVIGIPSQQELQDFYTNLQTEAPTFHLQSGGTVVLKGGYSTGASDQDNPKNTAPWESPKEFYSYCFRRSRTMIHFHHLFKPGSIEVQANDLLQTPSVPDIQSYDLFLSHGGSQFYIGVKVGIYSFNKEPDFSPGYVRFSEYFAHKGWGYENPNQLFLQHGPELGKSDEERVLQFLKLYGAGVELATWDSPEVKEILKNIYAE